MYLFMFSSVYTKYSTSRKRKLKKQNHKGLTGVVQPCARAWGGASIGWELKMAQCIRSFKLKKE